MGVAEAGAGRRVFESSSPVSRSNARKAFSATAPMNTRPLSLTVGPPRLGVPQAKAGAPGARSRTVRSGTSQRTALLSRSTTNNVPHGGFRARNAERRHQVFLYHHVIACTDVLRRHLRQRGKGLVGRVAPVVRTAAVGPSLSMRNRGTGSDGGQHCQSPHASPKPHFEPPCRFCRSRSHSRLHPPGAERFPRVRDLPYNKDRFSFFEILSLSPFRFETEPLRIGIALSSDVACDPTLFAL